MSNIQKTNNSHDASNDSKSLDSSIKESTSANTSKVEESHKPVQPPPVRKVTLKPASKGEKVLLKSGPTDDSTTKSENSKTSNAKVKTDRFKLSRLFKHSNKSKKSEEKEEETSTITSRVMVSPKTLKEGKKLLQTRADETPTGPTTLKRSVLTTKLTKKATGETTQTGSGTQKVVLRNSVNSTVYGMGEPSHNFQDIDPDAKKILIVDDEISILKVLSHIFRKQGYAPFTCTTGEQALEVMKTQKFDLLISDLRLGTQMDGLDLLHEVRASHPDVPVVIITGYASVKIAIQALKNGAFDLVTKPFKMDQLSEVVENALAHGGGYNIDKMVKQDLKLHFGMIVGEDEKMKNIYSLVKRISKTDATILIQGEEGTETDEFAQIIHHCSRRSNAPFIRLSGRLLSQQHVNPALISNMAVKADRGTLYIQDLHLLDSKSQEVLLELITTKKAKVHTIGDNATVDIRLVVSTTQPLKEILNTGSFSKELYYRMCAFTLDLPPLRHRIEDIPLLINYYCYKYSEEKGKEVNFSDKAINILLNYSWPGNIKELENEVMQAATASTAGVVKIENLSEKVCQNSGSGDANKANLIGKAARKYLQQQVSSKSPTENISLKIRQKP